MKRIGAYSFLSGIILLSAGITAFASTKLDDVTRITSCYYNQAHESDHASKKTAGQVKELSYINDVEKGEGEGFFPDTLKVYGLNNITKPKTIYVVMYPGSNFCPSAYFATDDGVTGKVNLNVGNINSFRIGRRKGEIKRVFVKL